MFSGMVGVEVTNVISSVAENLSVVETLIIDFRGNMGGGIGALRVMSFFTLAIYSSHPCFPRRLRSVKMRFSLAVKRVSVRYLPDSDEQMSPPSHLPRLPMRSV